MNNTTDEVFLCLPPMLFQALVMRARDNNHCLVSEIILRIKRSLEVEASVAEHFRTVTKLQGCLKVVEVKLDELELFSDLSHAAQVGVNSFSASDFRCPSLGQTRLPDK